MRTTYKITRFETLISTIRGKLGRIIALVGDGQIDDAIENSNRLGFADSYARDAITVTRLVVNDLRLALEELEALERHPSEIDYIYRAEGLIRSAISRIGREGDEGEI